MPAQFNADMIFQNSAYLRHNWSYFLFRVFIVRLSSRAKSLTSQVAHGVGAYLRLAPSRCWYLFTYPGGMENWVSLGRKEGHTKIQISAELSWDRTGDLLVGRQRFYQLRQPCPPRLSSKDYKINCSLA